MHKKVSRLTLFADIHLIIPSAYFSSFTFSVSFSLGNMRHSAILRICYILSRRSAGIRSLKRKRRTRKKEKVKIRGKEKKAMEITKRKRIKKKGIGTKRKNIKARRIKRKRTRELIMRKVAYQRMLVLLGNWRQEVLENSIWEMYVFLIRAVA